MTWPVPKFQHGQHVKLIPCDGVKARVVDLHVMATIGAVEYEVRYFDSGKAVQVRVFEDELEAVDTPNTINNRGE